MSNLLETFVTVTHQDFNWPSAKPIVMKPTTPPRNINTQLYLPRTDPDDCRCAVHASDNKKIRYQQLAHKERRLRDELINVNRKMANLTSSMLDSACDIDDIMKSVYKTDYEKRSLPITRYRPLMAAVDSPIESQTMPLTVDLQDCYKDPTRFRYSAMERPMIQPAKPAHFLQVPKALTLWGESFTNRSEYMDNISKMGMSNIKNQQQYLEPLPSSRRRFGDCNL